MNSSLHQFEGISPLKGEFPAHCKKDLNFLKSFVRDILQEALPADPALPTDCRQYLLTGATGFVGRFVLYQLLSSDMNPVVHCLVRAENETAGKNRLIDALNEAGLWDECFAGRIRVVCGDVGKDRFGLSKPEFDLLCRRIDAICHFAADLSLASPYLQLRGTNVYSIRNVLELALTTRFKHVFFASTMGVFPAYFCAFGGQFSNQRIFSQLQPDLNLMKQFFPTEFIGYPWGKLVVEQVLLYAHSLGMPLAVFRLPQSGSSTVGLLKTDDIIVRIFAAAIQVGKRPPGMSLRRNMEPVDTLAKICVAIAQNPSRKYIVYHCCETSPVHHGLELSELGIYLQKVSYPQFKRACLARGKGSPLNNHWLLLDHFAPHWFCDDGPEDGIPVSERAIREDCPFPIRWASSLEKLARSMDWIFGDRHNWPYTQPRIQLDFDCLCAQAEKYARQMGVPFKETYPGWLLGNLKQYVQALNHQDVKFKHARRAQTAFELNRLLRENAMLARERKSHPEISAHLIRNPIFILGINRTGTTFLHRLMSRDPKLWTLKAYELVESVLPDADYATQSSNSGDPRRLLAQDLFDTTQLPKAVAGIHHVDIDEAEEDFKLLNLSFASWTSVAFNWVPGYEQHLKTADHCESYRHHFRIMQHYSWQRQISQAHCHENRWLLKMPFHLMELEALAKIYPDAWFIQTHRQPTEFMGSWVNLVKQIRSLVYEPQPAEQLGVEQLQLMASMMNRAMDFRINHPQLESRWIDVDYSRLVTDPRKVVSEIYGRLGLSLPPSTSQRMNEWILQQARHRKSEVRYQVKLSDFGLDRQTVEDAFSRYFEFMQQLDF